MAQDENDVIEASVSNELLDSRTPFERGAFQDAWEYTKLLREHVQRRYFECYDESLLVLIARLDFWLKGTEHKRI